MDLKVIKEGLDSRHAVSDHCGYFPMTNGDGGTYEDGEDPCSTLYTAADAAERIIDTLINNPDLADAVNLAMK